MSEVLAAPGASEAAAAIAGGSLTSSALLEACLARIAARDGEIHAFARLAPDAREKAAEADRADHRGLLHGVPVAIKDLIDTEGLGTEYGSPIFAGHVPASDANCVMRLKAAGAIVLGKTVTTEFGHITPAATRNPRDRTRTPGGSSSGSAAAVADLMAPVALGTQTGGSVIRPASYCGVFGFKSSIGRTNTRGVHELAGSLDTVGWFARAAEDLSLLGRVLLSLGKPSAAEAPERPRFGCLRTSYDNVADAAALAARDAACAALQQAGAEIVQVAPPREFGTLNALHRRIVSAEASRAFARYAAEHPEKLSPALASFIADGRRNEAGYEEARELAKAARHRLTGLMDGIDAFVLPAATGEAQSLATTGDATFSLFWSLLGPPCATIPAATGPCGLPIGVQLVGRFGHDEELLALVEWAAKRLLR